MNLRRLARMTGLAMLAVPARVLDTLATHLDAHRWPIIAPPMVTVADFIERCRERLERATPGGRL